MFNFSNSAFPIDMANIVLKFGVLLRRKHIKENFKGSEERRISKTCGRGLGKCCIWGKKSIK